MKVKGHLYRKLKPHHKKRVENVFHKLQIKNKKSLNRKKIDSDRKKEYSTNWTKVFFISLIVGVISWNFSFFLLSAIICYIIFTKEKENNDENIDTKIKNIPDYKNEDKKYPTKNNYYKKMTETKKENINKIYGKSEIKNIEKNDTKLDTINNVDDSKDFIDSIKFHGNTQDPIDDIYLDDKNFELFSSFLYNAKKSIDIVTNRIDSKRLIELLKPLEEKNIRIRVITANITEKSLLEYYKEKNKNIELRKISKIHAKVIILDEKRILTGSSNIKSMNNFFETNIISSHKESVELAQEFFNSLWRQKSEGHILGNSKFVYTINKQEFLPECIEELIKKENKEIILFMPAGLIDRLVIKHISKLRNNNTKINLIIGNKWSSFIEEMDIDKKETMEWLSNIANKNQKDIKDFKIRCKKVNNHSKVYIFKGQKIAIVSSQNLTIGSWAASENKRNDLLESAFIIQDKNQIKKIIETIDSFGKADFESIGKIEETLKNTFSSNYTSKEEEKYGIPWQLSDTDRIIEKTKSNIRYKIKKPSKIIQGIEEDNKTSRLSEYENIGHENLNAGTKREKNYEPEIKEWKKSIDYLYMKFGDFESKKHKSKNSFVNEKSKLLVLIDKIKKCWEELLNKDDRNIIEYLKSVKKIEEKLENMEYSQIR